MQDSFYSDKAKKYFSTTRRDIIPFFPKKVDTVLEIGCGSGETLGFLKNNGYCTSTYGVELSIEAASAAEKKVDFLFQGNIEEDKFPFEASFFNTILCLDVLEHLLKPEITVEYIHSLLSPNGTLIATIPNVRHYSVLLPLIFKGRWDYQESGILDRTHLRFFVKDTAINLIKYSSLKIEAVASNYAGSRGRIFNTLTLSIFQDFLAMQYLIVAKRTN